MKKYIVVSKEDDKKLINTYKVSDKTVYNALNYNAERGFSKKAEAIRETAMANGGVLMFDDCKGIETLHFADGTMRQCLPGEIIITVEKNGQGTVTKRGTVVKRFQSPLIDEYEKLQNEVSPFISDHTATVLR